MDGNFGKASFDYQRCLGACLRGMLLEGAGNLQLGALAETGRKQEFGVSIETHDKTQRAVFPVGRITRAFFYF